MYLNPFSNSMDTDKGVYVLHPLLPWMEFPNYSLNLPNYVHYSVHFRPARVSSVVHSSPIVGVGREQ